MINKEEAIEIAKKEALLQGWWWEEPVDIFWRSNWLDNNGKWEIRTNIGSLSSYIKMSINGEGEIIKKEFFMGIR